MSTSDKRDYVNSMLPGCAPAWRVALPALGNEVNFDHLVAENRPSGG
jgi:hypothetical protein